MDPDRVISLDLGVSPEAAVSGGLLLQTESSVFFLFNAMRDGDDGRSTDAGTAVIGFDAPLATRFGHPNDEVRRRHPILGEVSYGVFEIAGSSWLDEARRLTQKTFPGAALTGVRHFVITLHDSTFECLARGLSLDVHEGGYESAFRQIAAKAMEDPR